MFKRMSVLVRRPGDDRATFSRGWERHAAPVSGLPRVRGYIQNHVEEDFVPFERAPIAVDGFVELLWDRPEDMAAAFASPAARPMVEDEPGFLGHGSGYALAAAPEVLDPGAGAKLIVVAVTGEDRRPLDGLEARLAALPGLGRLERDEVVGLIPKPGMAPPQPVDAFFHLQFATVEAAGAAGRALAADPPEGLGVGIYRVRTICFV